MKKESRSLCVWVSECARDSWLCICNRWMRHDERWRVKCLGSLRESNRKKRAIHFHGKIILQKNGRQSECDTISFSIFPITRRGRCKYLCEREQVEKMNISTIVPPDLAATYFYCWRKTIAFYEHVQIREPSIHSSYDERGFCKIQNGKTIFICFWIVCWLSRMDLDMSKHAMVYRGKAYGLVHCRWNGIASPCGCVSMLVLLVLLLLLVCARVCEEFGNPNESKNTFNK